MITRSAWPSSSVGYWRGGAGIAGPDAGGAKPMAQGTAGLSTGTGSVSIAGAEWHPSILYLLVLVLAEMVVFRWVGQLLR